jgi:adenylosuccinate synthase
MSGADDFARLAKRLKDAGETGLRRELNRRLNDAVKPFARDINAAEYLYPYMPNHYADMLAGDMKVTTTKRATGYAYGVAVKVAGRMHKRAVETLNRGILRHPVFAGSEIDRRDWKWVTQTASMRPGFFTDAVKEAAPEIRREMEDAIQIVADKITHG